MAPLNSAVAQSGVCLLTPSLAQAPIKLPDDVCGDDGVSSSDFYELSWQIFKFLVWPAASGQRGTSDRTKGITSMQGPRVFETFKADWEIFRPDAEEPDPWHVYPPREPCSNQQDVSPGALVLASFSKFGNLKQGEQADSHVLVAQNRSYVRYQSGYNKILFDKIVGSRLYDASVVGTVAAAPVDGPVPDATKSPHGAMTVKSAWIELSGAGGNIDPSRFYVRHDAWVQDPGKSECRKASVGLVGLHVVYKTKSRPQWIWSTFEHVDNVPEPDDGPGKRYTFHNGDLATHMLDGPEPAFLVSTLEAAGPGEPPSPYQVERRQQIAPKVLQVNLTWQGELRRIDSVWQNYKLIMSQWPFLESHPDRDAEFVQPQPPCRPTDTTPATANTTMETFQQRCEFDLTCMGCHNNARRTDFIWAIRLNKYKPPGFGAPLPREEAIKTLQDILGKRR
jgi:hypothetical protein